MVNINFQNKKKVFFVWGYFYEFSFQPILFIFFFFVPFYRYFCITRTNIHITNNQTYFLIFYARKNIEKKGICSIMVTNLSKYF